MVWYLESHKEAESLQRICTIPMCSQGRSPYSFSDLFRLVLCVKGKLPGQNLRLDLLREKSLPEPLKPAIDQPVWASLCRQVKKSTKGKTASMQHQELQSVGFASKRLNNLRFTVTGNLPMESIDSSHDTEQRLLRPGILWFLCVPCGNTECSPAKKAWLQALQKSERERENVSHSDKQLNMCTTSYTLHRPSAQPHYRETSEKTGLRYGGHMYSHVTFEATVFEVQPSNAQGRLLMFRRL